MSRSNQGYKVRSKTTEFRTGTGLSKVTGAIHYYVWLYLPNIFITYSQACRYTRGETFADNVSPLDKLLNHPLCPRVPEIESRPILAIVKTGMVGATIKP